MIKREKKVKVGRSLCGFISTVVCTWQQDWNKAKTTNNNTTHNWIWCSCAETRWPMPIDYMQPLLICIMYGPCVVLTDHHLSAVQQSTLLGLVVDFSPTCLLVNTCYTCLVTAVQCIRAKIDIHGWIPAVPSNITPPVHMCILASTHPTNCNHFHSVPYIYMYDQ